MPLTPATYSFVDRADYSPALIRAADRQQNFSPIGQAPAPSEAQSAERLYELGVESHRAGLIDAAIQSYQSAIRLDPKFDAAYINLGLALIQLGHFDDAKDILQQVLALPDRTETPASVHTLAHYNLAIIWERQGQPDEAVTEVQKALAITPDFELAQQLLQRLQ